MKIKMITQTPSDKNRVTWIHYGIAWVAARAIAVETHNAVILYGEFGMARFNGDGSGHVLWNEKSTKPNEVTEFCDKTTVCI